VKLYRINATAFLYVPFNVFNIFFREFRGTEEQKHHFTKSPSLITLLVNCSRHFLATIAGAINLMGNNWLNHFLENILVKKSMNIMHLVQKNICLWQLLLTGAIVELFGLILNMSNNHSFQNKILK
jgi:NADH-quinone oxidoreductase subunit L